MAFLYPIEDRRNSVVEWEVPLFLAPSFGLGLNYEGQERSDSARHWPSKPGTCSKLAIIGVILARIQSVTNRYWRGSAIRD